PPAQAGVHRRDPGRWPVQRRLADAGTGAGQPLEPVHPGQRQEEGRAREGLREEPYLADSLPIPMSRYPAPGLPTWLAAAWILALALAASPALALDGARAAAMASGATGARIEAVEVAVASPDAALADFLQAMLDGRVRLLDGRAIIVAGDGTARDAVDGSRIVDIDAAKNVVNNNRMRRGLGNAIAALELFSADDATRLDAARRIADKPDPGRLALIERALADEPVAGIRSLLEEARAAILVSSPEPATRLAAARELGASREPSVKALLERRLHGAQAEADAQVRQALTTSLAS